MKIDNYNISDKIIKQMNIYRKKSIEDGTERGFRLCQNLKTKNVTIGGKCKGDNCSILMSESKCDKNEISIGTFHTHPPTKLPFFINKGKTITHSEMSDGDTCQSIINDEKISCIGSVDGINCYVPISKKLKRCSKSYVEELTNYNSKKINDMMKTEKGRLLYSKKIDDLITCFKLKKIKEDQLK